MPSSSSCALNEAVPNHRTAVRAGQTLKPCTSSIILYSVLPLTLYFLRSGQLVIMGVEISLMMRVYALYKRDKRSTSSTVLTNAGLNLTICDFQFLRYCSLSISVSVRFNRAAKPSETHDQRTRYLPLSGSSRKFSSHCTVEFFNGTERISFRQTA